MAIAPHIATNVFDVGVFRSSAGFLSSIAPYIDKKELQKNIAITTRKPKASWICLFTFHGSNSNAAAIAGMVSNEAHSRIVSFVRQSIADSPEMRPRGSGARRVLMHPPRRPRLLHPKRFTRPLPKRRYPPRRRAATDRRKAMLNIDIRNKDAVTCFNVLDEAPQEVRKPCPTSGRQDQSRPRESHHNTGTCTLLHETSGESSP